MWGVKREAGISSDATVQVGVYTCGIARQLIVNLFDGLVAWCARDYGEGRMYPTIDELAHGECHGLGQG